MKITNDNAKLIDRMCSAFLKFTVMIILWYCIVGKVIEKINTIGGTQ